MAERDRRLKILVLHGPNLNLLGRREPHIYGRTTLAEIDDRLRRLGDELNADVETFQSNHEGALLDHLHLRLRCARRLRPQPGGPDPVRRRAARLHQVPALPRDRGAPLQHPHAGRLWRRHSIIGEAARGSVMGLGWRSYTAALRALVELVREETPPALRVR